jgi:hypothetical protein
MVYRLGMAHCLVGRSHECDWPPAALLVRTGVFQQHFHMIINQSFVLLHESTGSICPAYQRPVWTLDLFGH